MPTLISSCREERYCGMASPGEYGLARFSHTGAHSEPGEAKMYSIPILPSRPKNASAPLKPFTSIGALPRGHRNPASLRPKPFEEAAPLHFIQIAAVHQILKSNPPCPCVSLRR